MDHHPAPFWRRLLARLFDLLFSLALAFVLVLPVTLLALPFMPLMTSEQWGPVGAITCLVLAYVVLESFLLVRRQGQTLGKGLMGLRVVRNAADPSAPLTLGAALARLAVLLLPFVLMSVSGNNLESTVLGVLSGLGALSLVVSLVLAALRSLRCRVLHDLVAGTRVVRAPKRRVVLRDDLRMMVPGRIDMTKRL